MYRKKQEAISLSESKGCRRIRVSEIAQGLTAALPRQLPRAKTSFAEASYARQFCYICGSLFVLKGGRVFVEHCKKRKHKRGIHGFCCVCNGGVLLFADVIRAAVEKAGLGRSVALKAVDRLADAFEVTDGVIDASSHCCRDFCATAFPAGAAHRLSEWRARSFPAPTDQYPGVPRSVSRLDPRRPEAVRRVRPSG